MSKTYIAVTVKNMDEFDADVARLVKPEYLPNAEELTEEIQAEMEATDSDCTQVWDYHLDSEQTLVGHDINFKFNITDNGFSLAIEYFGYDE